MSQAMENQMSTDNQIKRTTSIEFTRPSDTNAYAAGDVVGPATTPAAQLIAGAGRYNKGGGLIRAVRLFKDGATPTNGTFRVWFYTAAPTAVADNAAWAPLYTEKEYFIGYVDLDVMVGTTGGCLSQRTLTHTPIPFKCTTSKNLYAVVTALAAYTPANGEKFTISVTVEQE